jgi:hypothetical protein
MRVLRLAVEVDVAADRHASNLTASRRHVNRHTAGAILQPPFRFRVKASVALVRQLGVLPR